MTCQRQRQPLASSTRSCHPPFRGGDVDLNSLGRGQLSIEFSAHLKPRSQVKPDSAVQTPPESPRDTAEKLIQATVDSARESNKLAIVDFLARVEANLLRCLRETPLVRALDFFAVEIELVGPQKQTWIHHRLLRKDGTPRRGIGRPGVIGEEGDVPHRGDSRSGDDVLGGGEAEERPVELAPTEIESDNASGDVQEAGIRSAPIEVESDKASGAPIKVESDKASGDVQEAETLSTQTKVESDSASGDVQEAETLSAPTAVESDNASFDTQKAETLTYKLGHASNISHPL